MSSFGVDPVLASQFVASCIGNPHNAELLRRLPSLGLPDCWLVAGCLFQCVWNDAAGRSTADGVKDYDIFYFDAADLSYDAEDRAIAHARSALADLHIDFDLKNEARVHLWYEQRFGRPYSRLQSARDGIDSFLVAGTCIGLAPATNDGSKDNAVDLYVPFGLGDIFDGILRPNPLSSDGTSAFAAKAKSYQSRWPHLTISHTPAPPPDRARTARVALCRT